jgi:hypothetical protein
VTQPVAATNHPDGTRTYAVPHRSTGEVFDLPNITGIIGLADPKHICEWKLKMAMLGSALRDDIAAQVAAANLLPAGPPRNGDLRRVAELAMTAGQIIEKQHLPSDRGTALHSLTERLDDLVPAGAVVLVDELGLPKRFADIAREYVAAMAGVRILHTEVTVASFVHRYAGTGDRIVAFEPLDAWRSAFDQWDLGRGCFFLDAKFGKVHDEAALQLAALANAETIWDAEAGTHTPLPDDLRRDVGFIFNPDKGLIPVPLDGAHEAFLGLVALKRWQDRGKVPEPTAAPICEACNLGLHVCQMCRAPVGHGIETCGEIGGGCVPDPVHISEALPRVIEAIPEPDVFAGLPDHDGRPQADRTAKRAWLIKRIDVLRGIANGVEQLAALWPAGVPTFKQSPDHTLDQLDLIAKAITVAEAQVQAPFPENDDPTDPANITVAADDPRIAALIERLKLLPPDLAAAVAAEAKAAKVPQLNGTRRITEAHLSIVEPFVVAAETEYMPRAKRIDGELAMAAEHGVSEAGLCAALKVPSARHIHGDTLSLLSDLVAAIEMAILAERDGVLVVDQPAAVLTAYGDDRTRVWRAGQTAAKANGVDSPKDSDAVLSHPVLAAVLSAV